MIVPRFLSRRGTRAENPEKKQEKIHRGLYRGRIHIHPDERRPGVGSRPRRSCRRRAAGTSPSCLLPTTEAICISLSRRNSVSFPVSDLDDREFKRLARPVAFQNTIDRLRQTPSKPLSKTNGILNRGLSAGAASRSTCRSSPRRRARTSTRSRLCRRRNQNTPRYPARTSTRNRTRSASPTHSSRARAHRRPPR